MTISIREFTASDADALRTCVIGIQDAERACATCTRKRMPARMGRPS
jgi:hypothetical protein